MEHLHLRLCLVPFSFSIHETNAYKFILDFVHIFKPYKLPRLTPYNIVNKVKQISTFFFYKNCQDPKLKFLRFLCEFKLV